MVTSTNGLPRHQKSVDSIYGSHLLRMMLVPSPLPGDGTSDPPRVLSIGVGE
jgi:hypothetical protein